MSEATATVFIAAGFLALLYAVIRYPLASALIVASLVVLVISRRADADTFEVSAIIESEADRTSMQDAARDAASIIKDALGVDVVVTYTDINTVAGHTQAAFLLDAVKAYRVDHAQHAKADATVLFTRRDIRIGGSDYTGIATVGPSCSASASAIVELRNDGEDGAILAHELLHTVGVPHDHAPGWLMSEGISRTTGRAMSPDSVLTFRAAGTGECMRVPVANPPPAAVQAQPAAPSTGGGGSFDTFVIIFLTGLACWKIGRIQARKAFDVWFKAAENLVKDQDATIQRLQTELEAANATINRRVSEEDLIHLAAQHTHDQGRQGYVFTRSSLLEMLRAVRNM
jgi:hypothetical protein